MNFEMELQILLMHIKNAEDEMELDYLRRTNEKKYWWTNILFCGLFYGLNGKVGKMLLSWLLCWTGYPIYLIYKGYKDQKEFNDAMEHGILKRKKELKKQELDQIN